MKNTKSYIPTIKSFFLLFLFIGYYGSITLFYHTHLENNHIITHSHPYKHKTANNTPCESHSHSSSAFSIIKLLNHPNWINIPDTTPIPEPIFFLYDYFFGYIQPHINTNNYLFAQLRAPPLIG